MTCDNLRNKVPLGVLQYGTFPKPSETPIEYLYYRPNGDLMLYRTSEAIEINLTNISAYENETLFLVTDKDNLNDVSINQFTSRSIDVLKSQWGDEDIYGYESVYPYRFIRPKHQYLYFLVPAIYGIQTILFDENIVDTLFDIIGSYANNNTYYYVYRSKNTINIEKDFTLTVIYNILKAENLNAFMLHIGDYNNPHKVTLEQLGISKLSSIYWTEGTNDPVQSDLSLIRGTTDELKQVPIIDKQILFDITRKYIYLDNDTKRIKFAAGIEILNDGDANKAFDSPLFYCKGVKQNFPLTLNKSSEEFILINNKINGILVQLIYLNEYILTRNSNTNGNTWSDWSIINLSDFQTKIDNNLQTESKEMVNAINELNNTFNKVLFSEDIREIKIVNKPIYNTEPILYIVLKEDKEYTLTINPTPIDSLVILNDFKQNSITVKAGTKVNYYVSHENYFSKTGSIILNEDISLDVILTERPSVAEGIGNWAIGVDFIVS